MFKRLLSIIMTTVIICSISVVALAAEQDIVTNQDSMNEIIAEINSEYGTNIHILSKEELKKYGLPENTNDNEVNFDSNSFEKELRYIAEVEIPEYDRITKESISGLQSKESTLNYFNTEGNTTNISINSASPVTAKKAINYATAGAKAYIKKNNYGNNVWGTVTNVFCETNMYQTKWFLSVNPSVSKIDAGRTLYWTGTGDYCGYVGGKQIYYSSGTQHAELYVGKYA